MNYNILCIGNIKKLPEKNIFNNFQKRLKHKLFLKEYVSSLPSGSLRKKDESKKLLSMLQGKEKTILLDERGENYSSEEFAHMLLKWRIDGINQVSFIIGGADGVSDQVFKSVNKILSFGKMTWPHILTRLMLIEQIYRSESIISNHPYHRR